MACQASNARQDGLASTASGTSHRLYCGLHTLLVSRNPATRRNSSWGSRGRRRAPSANAPTPRHTASTPTATAAFSTFGAPPEGTARSNGLPRMNWSTCHSESGSASRLRLLRKNVSHASRYSR